MRRVKSIRRNNRTLAVKKQIVELSKRKGIRKSNQKELKRKNACLPYICIAYTIKGGCMAGRRVVKSFMDSFGWIWQLLAPQGELCRRMGACRRLWDSFDLEKQRAIYRTIRDKLAAGEFVSENPYYAIYDNAYPPRKRQRIMSYADYYAKYGTTEPRDGWHRVYQPEKQRTIFVKQI